jgi:hypothetical protein
MTGRGGRWGLTASQAGLAAGLGCALLQLWPVLGRGYVLVRDMVFVPRLPLDAHVLGLDGVPRAVPSDLLVALASRVLPGSAVQDLILVAIIALAGWGAARLATDGRVSVAVAAAVLYSWNPYLAERLRQGQWAVLIGYAALPWVARCALALHGGAERSGRRLFLALAAGATGGLAAQALTVLVAVPVACWPGGPVRLRRRFAVVVGSTLTLALPWLVPSLWSLSAPPPGRAGVSAFAARPDTPFATVGSLLSLGGIWNSQTVPPGRGSPLVALLALAMTVVALWAVWHARPTGAWRGLVVAAAIGFALALWAVTPGLRGLAADVGGTTAGGFLRDGQRWLAPFVLLVAVGFGWFVGEKTRRVRWAPALALVPVLLLPAAAWGSDGVLAAVRWPGDWAAVSSAANRLPPGPVLVLPWASERQYPWNADRVLTDPADHWLSRRVVGDDALTVGPATTRLEDPLAARIAAAASGQGGDLMRELQEQHYAGVLVELDQPGALAATAGLHGLPVVAATSTLRLFAVPDTHPRTPSHAPAWPAVTVDALVALAVVIVAASLARDRARGGRGV